MTALLAATWNKGAKKAPLCIVRGLLLAINSSVIPYLLGRRLNPTDTVTL
jgi:hypothetical protein